MSLKEGDTIPNVIFKTRIRNDSNTDNPFEWKDVSTDDLFANKRCVLFALPGAFTPICSLKHLPDYDNDYLEILSKGIDEVYCLSVNDAFVMRQWGLSLGLEEDTSPYGIGFKKVKLLPDGACQFTRGMGMTCTWTTERGFGERSWRYSMVVNNKIIEKMFVEEPRVINSEADPFEITDSKTMITYLS